MVYLSCCLVSVSAFAHKNISVQLEMKSTLVSWWYDLNFVNHGMNIPPDFLRLTK
jgi:hypothetical protein